MRHWLLLAVVTTGCAHRPEPKPEPSAEAKPEPVKPARTPEEAIEEIETLWKNGTPDNAGETTFRLVAPTRELGYRWLAFVTALGTIVDTDFDRIPAAFDALISIRGQRPSAFMDALLAEAASISGVPANVNAETAGQLHILRAQVRFAREERAEAYEELARIPKESPAWPRARVLEAAERALVAENSNDRAAAITLAREATTSPRFASTAYLVLARILYADGKDEEAFAAWKKAIELDDEKPAVTAARARLELGTALSARGEYDRALEFLSDDEARLASGTHGPLTLAQTHFFAGRLKESERALGEFAQLMRLLNAKDWRRVGEAEAIQAMANGKDIAPHLRGQLLLYDRRLAQAVKDVLECQAELLRLRAVERWKDTPMLQAFDARLARLCTGVADGTKQLSVKALQGATLSFMNDTAEAMFFSVALKLAQHDPETAASYLQTTVARMPCRAVGPLCPDLRLRLAAIYAGMAEVAKEPDRAELLERVRGLVAEMRRDTPDYERLKEAEGLLTP